MERSSTFLWMCRIALLVAILGFVAEARADEDEAKAVDRIRQLLRKEGFKTRFSDFHLSVAPEMQRRVESLTIGGAEPQLFGPPFPADGVFPRFSPQIESPEWMHFVDSNSAVVMWKLDTTNAMLLKARDGLPGHRLSYGTASRCIPPNWNQLRDSLGARRDRLDRAVHVILTGTIQFDLDSVSSREKFPHRMELLGTLMRLLTDRMMVSLHDGRRDDAWTNLWAATRLVTAGPSILTVPGHFTRLNLTRDAVAATWQFLQTDGWSDAQLARLQQEWKSIDYFAGLPDTAALDRTTRFAKLRYKEVAMDYELDYGVFFAWAWRFPHFVWMFMEQAQAEKDYRQQAVYLDEAECLLDGRAEEAVLRRAVSAATMPEMLRRLRVPDPFTARIMNRPLNALRDPIGLALVKSAGVAEAWRRAVLAALALERFHLKHGCYPADLSLLTPDFLKQPPIDFMDGRPLRFQREPGGKFILYSVSFDGHEPGKNLSAPGRALEKLRPSALPTGTLLWPLPASEATVKAAQEQLMNSR